MSAYVELPLNASHRLINHGPVVLVSTKDAQGHYDIAPIAWCTPVLKDPPRLAVVIGKSHKTYHNIFASKEFIVVVPHADQVEIVRQTGSVSGRDQEKFAHFNIENFPGQKVDALIPDGCVGYLECSLKDSSDQDKTDIIAADVIYSAVKTDAFDKRLLVEKHEGKTLHHLGERIFTVPADRVLE